MVLGCSNDTQVNLDVPATDKKEQSAKSISSSTENTEKSQLRSNEKRGDFIYHQRLHCPH